MADAATCWVFGYGSLIWRPGFPFLSSQGAYLCGYHRDLCIYSHTYRGNPKDPGLVFGLVPGGCCEGCAFEVSASQWPQVLDYLQARESDVYHQVYNGVRIADGRMVKALVFVANDAHCQFAGKLSIDEQIRIVRHARGQTGSNRDYVLNTISHLEGLGIRDAYLSELGQRLAQEEPEQAGLPGECS